VRWAAHDVAFHRTATKQMHHPLVGDMTLAFEMLELPADPGLSVLIYSAEPGSPSEEAIRELARWSETRTKLSAAGPGSAT
jgi:MmyB-like transcription regulator ligand binding domain